MLRWEAKREQLSMHNVTAKKKFIKENKIQLYSSPNNHVDVMAMSALWLAKRYR